MNGCEDTVENSRGIISPRELDIFIPSSKLAIEYNGIWWHSLANGTPVDYHSSKSDACERLGIDLVHVLDHEWSHRQDLCKLKLLEENKLLSCGDDFAEVEVTRGLTPKMIRDFIIDNTLEDPLDFILAEALAIRQTRTKQVVLVIAKSRTSGCLKLVKKLGIVVNRTIVDLVKQHLESNAVIEAPRAWPAECHLLEKTFGMKLVSVEPPRIWCYVYNSHDLLLHLASNVKSITDNDYLIPDAGMKVFTFL